mmetsp:Transcript_20926/g.36002  ORF Transcript_20926/g.36002 Transcript_20926/m.36002 type:complete len:318 (-) Transcript_20926:1075-2028(-)
MNLKDPLGCWHCIVPLPHSYSLLKIPIAHFFSVQGGQYPNSHHTYTYILYFTMLCLGLKLLQLPLKIQFDLKSLQQCLRLAIVSLFQQLNFLLIICFQHFNLCSVRVLHLFRNLLDNIGHVDGIGLEEVFLRHKRFLLLIFPFRTFFFKLCSHEHGDVSLHVTSIHVFIDIIEGSHILLVLGEEPLGESLEDLDQNIIRDIVFHGQMDWKTSLDIPSSRGLGVGIEDLESHIIRGAKDQSGMEGQSAESKLGFLLLLSTGDHPSFTLLVELKVDLFEHFFCIGELSGLEGLEEISRIFVVVNLTGFRVKPFFLFCLG